MNEKSEKNTSEGDKTTIDLKKDTAFLKKSKKYAEIYIKQKKDNVMKKILKASNYDQAKELVKSHQLAVKNWSDVMRLNILLNLIVKHSKSGNGKNSYKFNLNAKNMQEQNDLPNEFKIGKKTDGYKGNPLHLLITGVDRLLKQKRAKQAYGIIMGVSKRDKFKNVVNKVIHAKSNAKNKKLCDMLNRLLKAESTSEFDGIIKKYDKYDSREFDIVRSFVSVFSDESLSDDQAIKKLYNKLCKLGTLCDNSLYLSLRELYDRFLYGYLNLKVDEELKKVSGVLNSLDFKDEENTLKVKKFVTNLISLFNNAERLKTIEEHLFDKLQKTNTILEACSGKGNITPEIYNSNQLEDVLSFRGESSINPELIKPLFKYVQNIFKQKFPDFKAKNSDNINTREPSSSNSKNSIIPKIQNFTDAIKTRRTIPRSRGVNSTNTNNSRTSHTEQTESDKQEEKIRRRMFGH